MRFFDVVSRPFFVYVWIALVTIISGLILAGWAKNLDAVIDLWNEPVSGEFLIRVVALVVIPLGGVIGWV